MKQLSQQSDYEKLFALSLNLEICWPFTIDSIAVTRFKFFKFKFFVLIASNRTSIKVTYLLKTKMVLVTRVLVVFAHCSCLPAEAVAYSLLPVTGSSNTVCWSLQKFSSHFATRCRQTSVCTSVLRDHHHLLKVGLHCTISRPI